MITSRPQEAVAVLGTIRAMDSDISIYGLSTMEPLGPDPVIDQALAVFTSVHEACTRFDPDSPLMRANARPDQWHVVPLVLLAAVREAHRAYRRTDGRFDPRILGDLERLGDHAGLPATDDRARVAPTRRPLPRWTPRFRYGRRPELHLGGMPIDLGGIGKSLAVRWASEELQEHFDEFLLDAGNDCYCEGSGPDENGWRVGIEDPFGGDLPLAVLAVTDKGCATSSVALRHGQTDPTGGHQLIDPISGRPGGEGLMAVTVLDDDPTRAEVAAKYLFLGGADEIGPDARSRRTAALWITSDGDIGISPALEPFVVWRA